MTGKWRRVDYDQVAPSYDRRFAYAAGERRGVATALTDLAGDVGATRILEVGCGTGRWLSVLRNTGAAIFGVDPSPGMLERARQHSSPGRLLRGVANALPCLPGSLDLIFCVSALHHFDDPAAFVRDARSLLRPGGALAVIGINPHSTRTRWYLYDYFEGTYEEDLRRYPSSGILADWMIDVGFDEVDCRIADTIADTRRGEHVFDDPMLHKNATSVLTPLTDEQYQTGLDRIRAANAAAQAIGETAVFPVDLALMIVTGRIR